MGNPIVVKACIHALEKIIDGLKIEQEGIGLISGMAKYHINDNSVVKLIKTTAKEINYDNEYNPYEETPREKLYWTFNGHGLNSPDEIKKEINHLIRAAKKIL